MKLLNSTEADIEQLTEWIKADPYHEHNINPTWWLTGSGLLSYCIQDSIGPTMYVRIDAENGLMRIHTQFAPESEVSKLRVVKCLIKALPVMEFHGRKMGMTGFVYKSTSESLIEFMQKKFGFTPTGSDDDYWRPFEVQN
jgi:hypothetical protein